MLNAASGVDSRKNLAIVAKCLDQNRRDEYIDFIKDVQIPNATAEAI